MAEQLKWKYSTQLMHEIRDLTQGFTVSQVTNNNQYGIHVGFIKSSYAHLILNFIYNR